MSNGWAPIVHGEGWDHWEDHDADGAAPLPATRQRQNEDGWRGRAERSDQDRRRPSKQEQDHRSRWEQDRADSDESGHHGNEQTKAQVQEWQQEPSDITDSPWLSHAATDVYQKIKECQFLDMLKRSLSPGSVPEHDWQQLALYGSTSISHRCMQRSLVVVGSFANSDSLQQLNCTCSAQVGLATVFQHLQLRRLLPPQFTQDEKDEVKSASILACIYGELLDPPADGESAARENARRVAEWALLDFIFLLGVTRMCFGFGHSPLTGAYGNGMHYGGD